MPSYEGHLAGYDKLKDVVIATFDMGVEYVTAYIFSTENWQRSQDEVKGLMNLVLKMLTSDLHVFEENDIKLRILGSREGVDKKIIKAMDNAESKTANNKRGVLALCFNYGGRLEIVDAIKQIINSGIKPNKINAELIEQYLYSPDIPDIDLVLRTSGEKRLSNFMLWRTAYSEMIFINKNWPDMKKSDVRAALNEYTRRQRRFGS
jgi:undecaprenyl diphosphate synthase